MYDNIQFVVCQAIKLNNSVVHGIDVPNYSNATEEHQQCYLLEKIHHVDIMCTCIFV